MGLEQIDGRLDRRGLLKGAAAAGTGALVGTLVAAGRRVSAAAEGGQQTRWGFLIDLRRCIGCRACTVACKTENDVRIGVFRSSVKELESGTFPDTKKSFLPWLCNHCKNPPCLAECPVDEIEAVFVWTDGTKESYKKRATYQRPDGLVLIDRDRCVGCGACVGLCPYKVRYQDPVMEADFGGAAAKGTLGAPRPQNGYLGGGAGRGLANPLKPPKTAGFAGSRGGRRRLPGPVAQAALG